MREHFLGSSLSLDCLLCLAGTAAVRTYGSVLTRCETRDEDAVSGGQGRVKGTEHVFCCRQGDMFS